MSEDGKTKCTEEVEASIVWSMPGVDFIVVLPDIAKNYV